MKVGTLSSRRRGTLVHRTVPIGLGSYVISGQPVNLAGPRRLPADKGTYLILGASTLFNVSGGSDLPPPTIVVTQDFGFTSYKPTGLPPNTVIDLTTSTFIINNSKNANPTPTANCSTGTLQTQSYPVDMQSAGAGLWVYHGRINGIVPQDSDWSSTYCGSAVSFRFQNCPGPNIANGGPTLSDTRIDRTWDAIRFIYSNNWTIQRVHASYIRDDAIENDVQEGGQVLDSLFDGSLSFMACVPSSNAPMMKNPDGTPIRQHILLDGVLSRLRLSNQGGVMTHGSPFKYDTDLPWRLNNPQLTIRNCVFAISTVAHNGKSRLSQAWLSLMPSGHTNNYFLNLSDTPLPSGYPFPPAHANFTILQAQPARDYWETARQAWLDAHPSLPV